MEYAHTIAPGANILLVETPVPETEGVTGFPQIVEAENYVITHHLGDVISQSFSAGDHDPSHSINVGEGWLDQLADLISLFVQAGTRPRGELPSPVQEVRPEPASASAGSALRNRH